MFESFQQETADRQVARQTARLETWLAVYDLAGRRGSSNLGKLLTHVKQDQAARDASKLGL